MFHSVPVAVIAACHPVFGSFIALLLMVAGAIQLAIIKIYFRICIYMSAVDYRYMNVRRRWWAASKQLALELYISLTFPRRRHWEITCSTINNNLTCFTSSLGALDTVVYGSSHKCLLTSYG